LSNPCVPCTVLNTDSREDNSSYMPGPQAGKETQIDRQLQD
jgi:hypothetical protein